MNLSIMIAFFATIITILVYSLAGKANNKYLRGTIQIASVIVGIFVTGAVSSDSAVAAKSGEYFFYMMIAVAIGSKIFGKNNSRANA